MVMPADLPAEVQRFVLDNLSSVEQLEALLLIRAEPDREWTPEELSKIMYSSPSAVQMRLEDLAVRGLARTSTGTLKSYRYESSRPETNQLLNMLAELYRERRVAIISLI